MIDFLGENAAYLLGREIREVIDERTVEYIRGKVVLVTGGGGSIGSELCIAAARCGVGRIIILDINENNAHDVSERLACDFAQTDVTIEIASIRDRERVGEVFARHRPELVFHAAAHKHVSLMETCPAEAVKNNVLGTVNVADAAEEYGAGRFMLISTDKAVEPTSVMGATKRLCEHIIASRADSSTSFAAVRFGNVLGSAGSVMPSFMRAIERGETLHITDKNAERYFMTIPEAAGLVLCASAMSEHGVYVLDMGEPVAIVTLAKRLGELLGRAVDMRYTSLGDGEKLCERLFYDVPIPTANERISMEPQVPRRREDVANAVRMLAKACRGGDVKAALRAAVAEYK